MDKTLDIRINANAQKALAAFGQVESFLTRLKGSASAVSKTLRQLGQLDFNRLQKSVLSMGDLFEGARSRIHELNAALEGQPQILSTIASELQNLITTYNQVTAAAAAAASAMSTGSVPSAETASTSSGFASGGLVPGASPHSHADNILARLTAGEFVLPVPIVKKLGLSYLEGLRSGLSPEALIPRLKGYSFGGLVGFSDPFEGLTPFGQIWTRAKMGALNALGTDDSGTNLASAIAGNLRNMGSITLNTGGASTTLFGDASGIEALKKSIQREKWTR